MKRWRKRAVLVRRAEMSDCDALSEIHAKAFRRGWTAAEFEALLLLPGTHALLAHYRSAFDRRTPAGFLLYRLAADEAEILSVAVIPECRRRGIGKTLLEETMRNLYRDGGTRIHLEVEDSNHAAIALYRGVEFRESGRRASYYTEGRNTPGGAIVMLRELR